MPKTSKNLFLHSEGNGGTQAAAINPKIDGEIISLIKEFFKLDGLTGPVENLNFLLNHFMADAKEWSVNCLQDTTFDTTQLISFLTRLNELMERRIA